MNPISSNNPQAAPRGRLKTGHSGMTLVEVLISMFVLAIGVLALLAVQLRSVSGVREAESQTIVSQITQNLIEGMMVNPVLTAETDPVTHKQSGLIHKSYDQYLKNNTEIRTTSAATYGSAISKQNLANQQIAEFEHSLRTALPDAQIFYTICRDTSGREPTYSGSAFASNCTPGTNAATVIKVLWLTEAEEENAPSGIKTAGSKIIYTHQSRVTE